MKLVIPVQKIDRAFYTVEDRDFFTGVATLAARLTRGRYREHVEHSDLVGEAWLWAYSRPNSLQAILDVRDVKLRERKLLSALCNHLAEWARRERAHHLGYRPEDEVFYSLGTLRALLPDVYEPENWASGEKPNSQIRVKADAAEGGNAVATYADIARVLEGLSDDDQRVLYLRFAVEDSYAAIGLELGVAPNAARQRTERALKRLHRQLGGARPWADVPEEYIGSRRVITNAAAQAMTE